MSATVSSTWLSISLSAAVPGIQRRSCVPSNAGRPPWGLSVGPATSSATTTVPAATSAAMVAVIRTRSPRSRPPCCSPCAARRSSTTAMRSPCLPHPSAAHRSSIRYHGITGRSTRCDPGRAPLPWNPSPNGGFTVGTPWLPLHNGFHARNVEAQRADSDSIFNFYRSLIAVRRGSVALRRGVFENLTARPRRGWVFLREAAGERALVALNFTNRPLDVRLDHAPPGNRWELALSSTPRSPARLEGQSVHLSPFEAAVFFGVG